MFSIYLRRSVSSSYSNSASRGAEAEHCYVVRGTEATCSLWYGRVLRLSSYTPTDFVPRETAGGGGAQCAVRRWQPGLQL